MSYPPWPNWTEAQWRAARVQLIAKKEFEEALHPRQPGGTSEGGQFAETGRAGEATPNPKLATEAKTGIAAVEKLIPEALKTADFSAVQLTSWESLPLETQRQAKDYYRKSQYDEIDIQAIDADLTVDVRWSLKEGATAETAKMVADKTKVWVEGYLGEKPLDDFALDKSLSGSKPLDFKTLSVPNPQELTDAGYPVLDVNALRHTDGTELTEYEKGTMRGIWKHQYEKVVNDEIEKAQDSDEYLAKREKLVEEQVERQWDLMTDAERTNLVPSMIAGGEFKGTENPYGTARARVPEQWVTGVGADTPQDEHYARTHALALKLTELRTDELRKERGLLTTVEKPFYEVVKGYNHTPERPNYVIKDSTGQVVGASSTLAQAQKNAEEWAAQEMKNAGVVETKDLIEAVWHSWKGKSSQGFSLSLQLAAARELGGHHRMSPEEVKEAERFAESQGGIPMLQAYVRAQWEVTQMIMQKAGEKKVAVYRGLMLAGEDVGKTPTLHIDKLGKPIPPPSNITTWEQRTGQPAPTVEPARVYVSFDYNGVRMEVQKKRSNLPFEWDDVDEAIQEKVRTAFVAQVKEAAHELERTGKIPQWVNADDTFTRLHTQAKYNLLIDYIRTGKIPPQPFESDEVAVKRAVEEYHDSHVQSVFTKLPALQLQRAGAQSTTGTISVANEWGGVGEPPPDPVRVVLRIEAPATSVLSIPVFGVNMQEEHETVIVGTTDKWLWDAWRGKAPDFESQSIARKAETKPLVIDLQAEDRGKPHWMSTVDWAKIQQDKKS